MLVHTSAHNRSGRSAILRNFRHWEATRDLEQAEILERLAAVTDDQVDRCILNSKIAVLSQRGRDSLKAATERD
ncbi:MAG: hypothetical protein K8T91_25760 [Planctomycetes bacterium]|nr:hypothetical protein [Planctomycetota bacterium]